MCVSEGLNSVRVNACLDHVLYVTSDDRGCLNLSFDEIDMLLHAEQENVEARIDRVGNDVLFVCLSCINITYHVDEIL